MKERIKRLFGQPARGRKTEWERKMEDEGYYE